MRISDWSSDVCSSDLMHFAGPFGRFLTNVNRTMSQAGLIMPVARFVTLMVATAVGIVLLAIVAIVALGSKVSPGAVFLVLLLAAAIGFGLPMMIIGRLRDRRIRKLEEQFPLALEVRSEEHTSELQSLMRISYAVFCFKKKKI